MSFFFALTTTTTRNSEKHNSEYEAGLTLIEQEARHVKTKKELLEVRYSFTKYFNNNAQTSTQSNKAKQVMTIINTRLEYEFKYNSNEGYEELEERNY